MSTEHLKSRRQFIQVVKKKWSIYFTKKLKKNQILHWIIKDWLISTIKAFIDIYTEVKEFSNVKAQL